MSEAHLYVALVYIHWRSASECSPSNALLRTVTMVLSCSFLQSNGLGSCGVLCCCQRDAMEGGQGGSKRVSGECVCMGDVCAVLCCFVCVRQMSVRM